MPRPDALGELLAMFERALDSLLRGREARWQIALRRCSGSPRQASELLLQLRRGERTLSQFLDEKVTRALAPLKPLLDESDLEFLRISARESLDQDPVLGSLLARVSPCVPRPAQDGHPVRPPETPSIQPQAPSKECSTSASFSKRGTSRRLRFLS